MPWCQKWRINIGRQKPQVILFENNKKSSKIEITVNGSVIKQVKEKKILGIIVDENSYSNHILNTFVQKAGNHIVALQQSHAISSKLCHNL